MTIRTLMIDLHSARCSYWRNGRGVVSYQDIWQEMRRTLASIYHAVISGQTELEDNVVTIQAFGVDVGRFEIK